MAPSRKLAAALARLPLERARVLELGCGSGRHLPDFGHRSVGVDRDPQAVTAARSSGRDAQVVDLDRPGWSEGLSGFDAVFAADLLMHLARPEVLLAELTRPLVPDGRLVLCEWVWPERGALREFLARRVPGARAVWESPEHLRRYRESEVTALVEDAGFAVEACYVHSFRSAAVGRAVRSFWPPRTWIARVSPCT